MFSSSISTTYFGRRFESFARIKDRLRGKCFQYEVQTLILQSDRIIFSFVNKNPGRLAPTKDLIIFFLIHQHMIQEK